MTYETVVTELFERFPNLRSAYALKFGYMGDDPRVQYLVFGSMLIPFLERALERRDLESTISICSFLEVVAQNARKDPDLENLLGIEVGEWLGWAVNEEFLAPHLGAETKRICGYVSGLASQRLNLKAENHRFKRRLSSLLGRLYKK